MIFTHTSTEFQGPDQFHYTIWSSRALAQSCNCRNVLTWAVDAYNTHSPQSGMLSATPGCLMQLGLQLSLICMCQPCCPSRRLTAHQKARLRRRGRGMQSIRLLSEGRDRDAVTQRLDDQVSVPNVLLTLTPRLRSHCQCREVACKQQSVLTWAACHHRRAVTAERDNTLVFFNRILIPVEL